MRSNFIEIATRHEIFARPKVKSAYNDGI